MNVDATTSTAAVRTTSYLTRPEGRIGQRKGRLT
jgi:hypothetical protein